MKKVKALVLTRTYLKPISKVFDAFTNPANLKEWFAPGGLIVTIAEVNARQSGAYRIEMTEEKRKSRFAASILNSRKTLA